MRTYEVIFILRPDLPETETDALIEQMQQSVTGAGGRVTNADKCKWGKRPLAYRVHGQREGFFVLFEVEGGGRGGGGVGGGGGLLITPRGGGGTGDARGGETPPHRRAPGPAPFRPPL